MKKLFIFDFDGTLFDSVGDVIISFNKALKVHDFPTLTRKEYLECLGGTIDEITSLVLGENLSEDSLEKVKNTYLEFYNSSEKENTVPFPNTKKTLMELDKNGAILAINSNRLTYSLNEFVDKYFEEINFLEIEGHNPPNPSKPNPCGVEKILNKANVSKKDAVYIGDSATDIRTAKNAGIDCILVSWGYGNRNDYENEYVLDVLDDISQISNYF